MVKLSTLIFALPFFLIIAACSSEQGEQPPVTSTSGYSGGSSPYSTTSVAIESNLGSSQGTPKELEAIWEAWALLNKEHIDRASFDSDNFEESAIKGLIDSVEDTHTSYVDPLVLSLIHI